MKSLFPSLLFLSILSIEYASSTFLHTESYTKVCTSTRTFNFSFISSFSWAPRISWSKYSFIFWTFSEYSLNFLFLTENWLSPEENTYSAELSLGRCFYFHNLLTSDGVGVFFAPISCFHSIVPSPYWQTPCFCAISPSLPCIVVNILITLLHDLVTVVNEGSLCKSRQRLQYSGLHDLHILRDILHLSTSYNFHGHNLDLLFSHIAPFVTSVIQTSHSWMTTSSIQIICSSASPTSFLASSGFIDNGSLHILPVSQLLLPIPSASRVESMTHNLNHPFVNTLKPFATYPANMQTWMNPTNQLLLF